MEYIARIGETVLHQPPGDLYIPPEALKVLLTQFEGPLDLLLWLIKKNKFDILDIPIAQVARQYEHYITMMQALDMELAAEYLFMAAWLAEIKSQMLLPKPDLAEMMEYDATDPRAELMARLLQYEGYKQAAQWLEQRAQAEAYWPVHLPIEEESPQKPNLQLELLYQALGAVLQRQAWHQEHEVIGHPTELEDKLSFVLEQLKPGQPTPMTKLLRPEEGKTGIVVTFMALLELLKQQVIEVYQAQLFAPITIKRVT